MAWVEKNSGKKYFYLSVRSGAGVRRKYCGSGALALFESGRIEQKNRVLDQIRSERSGVVKGEAVLREHEAVTRDVVTGLMAVAGFSNARSRGWRAVDMAHDQGEPDTGKQLRVSEDRPIAELIKAAREGDRTAVPGLRRALLDDPSLMQANGHVACRTQVMWLELIAGRDLFRRECLILVVRKLKEDLIGEGNGTVVERMLIELAISTWLQLFYHEQKEARDPATNLALGEFRLRKIESAFNRHMRVLSSLSALKAVKFTERMADAMTAVVGHKSVEGGTSLQSARGKPTNRVGDLFAELTSSS